MSGRMSGLVFSESGLSIYFDVSSSALVLSAWSTPIFLPEPLWKKLCGWCHYFHKPRFVRRRVLCANVTIDYRCLPELWKTICSTILSHSLNRQLSAKVHSRIFWNRVREVLSFDIGDKNNSFHWICTWGKKKNLDQSNYRERWQTSDGVLQLKEAASWSVVSIWKTDVYGLKTRAARLLHSLRSCFRVGSAKLMASD